jgi:hypothetical protein
MQYSKVEWLNPMPFRGRDNYLQSSRLKHQIGNHYCGTLYSQRVLLSCRGGLTTEAPITIWVTESHYNIQRQVAKCEPQKNSIFRHFGGFSKKYFVGGFKIKSFLWVGTCRTLAVRYWTMKPHDKRLLVGKIEPWPLHFSLSLINNLFFNKNDVYSLNTFLERVKYSSLSISASKKWFSILGGSLVRPHKGWVMRGDNPVDFGTRKRSTIFCFPLPYRCCLARGFIQNDEIRIRISSTKVRL